jgi:hypothetical protein
MKNCSFSSIAHYSRLFGYVTNFYNVSRHVTDSAYANVPQARLEAYVGSEINAGDPHQGGRGLCEFHSGNCHSLSHACHYSTPEEMFAITDIVRQQSPGNFKEKKIGYN